MAVNPDGSNLDRNKYLRLLTIQNALRCQIATKIPAGTLLMQCRTCDEVKTIDHYRKALKNYYGLDVHCTECKRVNVPRYEVALEGTKVCRWCRTLKPVHAFVIDARRSDGRSNHCRRCVKQRTNTRSHRLGHDTHANCQTRRKQTTDLAIQLGLPSIPERDLKRCYLCSQVRDVGHYYSQPQNADGLEGRCDGCYRGYGARKNVGSDITS